MSGYRATHSAAERTLQLVGRNDILEQIEKAVEDKPRTHIVTLTGDGGIGKTMLLRHVLKQYQNAGEDVLVARELIDLYHPDVHSIIGFVRAAMDVLAFDDQAREEIIKAILDPEKSNEYVGKLFLQKLNDLATSRRVIMALDTVERVAGYEDPVQRALGLEVRPVTIWQWLTQVFLPQVKNAVVLMAGRPQPRPWWEDLFSLNDWPTHKVARLSIEGFTEEEVVAYIDALARSLVERGRKAGADRLHRLSEEERRIIFHALCDEEKEPRVRPIFLALALDYRGLRGSWPPGFPRTLEAARALSPEKRSALQQNLWGHLMEAINEAWSPANEAWSPANTIIRFLGWLPKGADASLLRQVGKPLGVEEKDIQAALKNIRDLSFVKLRPNDERYFLHDEMYELLEQYGEEPPPQVEAAIKIYYKERIRNLRYEVEARNRVFIAALSEPSEQTGDLLALSQEVLDLQAKLHNALVEDVYYRLRSDPKDGLDTYYRYVEEAVSLSDMSLDMQLRTELFTFLGNGKAGDARVDTELRREIYASEAIRWLRRLIPAGASQEAETLAKHLHDAPPEFLSKDDHLSQADLKATLAVLHTYLGHYKKAGKLLEQAGWHLKTFSQPVAKAPLLLNALRARYHNNYGYLRRTQGQFQAAKGAYWQALPYWRATKIEAEHANTLTNLAYVQALVGEFDGARRHVQDALELRLRLGFQGPIALTLNTWAQVELLHGHFAAAERLAKQALAVANHLSYRRASGLAHLTLANSYRFSSERTRLPSQRIQFLQKAEHHCNEAITIFSEEIPEPERLAEAYYVRGLVHRERCRRDAPLLTDDTELAKEKSLAEQDLHEALKLATENDLKVLYLDAMMGLAWLYYHVGEKEQAQEQIKAFKQFMKAHFPDYLLTPDHRPEVKEDTRLGVFAQLGRKHVLQGVMAMDEFWATKSPEALKEAARNFTLAQEYDYLIAEDFRDLQRAENTMHAHLKRLNMEELRTFYDGVRETVEKYTRCKPEECHMWKWLEENFGPYETLSGE